MQCFIYLILCFKYYNTLYFMFCYIFCNTYIYVYRYYVNCAYSSDIYYNYFPFIFGAICGIFLNFLFEYITFFLNVKNLEMKNLNDKHINLDLWLIVVLFVSWISNLWENSSTFFSWVSCHFTLAHISFIMHFLIWCNPTSFSFMLLPLPVASYHFRYFLYPDIGQFWQYFSHCTL